MNNQSQLKAWPPFLCVALARSSDGTALTYEQIAKESNLCVRQVSRIAAMLNWDNVKSKVVEDFLRGCNFQEPRKQTDFLRKTRLCKKKFAHLSTSRRKLFERRILAWQKLKK